MKINRKIFTENVQKFIQEEVGVKVALINVRCFLKQIIKYSFKEYYTKILIKTCVGLESFRLFLRKVTDLLSCIIIVVKVNESSLSMSMKQNYTWIKRGMFEEEKARGRVN
jgi:CO dehydrogenase nickel-insertion accessory protein CooC1